MEVTWALLADCANVSRDGKLNILGEFNTLTGTEPPFQIFQKSLVIKFHGSVHEQGVHRIGLRLVDEDGKMHWASSDAPITFPPPSAAGQPIRLQAVSSLPLIQINAVGAFELEILVDGSRLYAISLFTSLIPPPAANAAGERLRLPARGGRWEGHKRHLRGVGSNPAASWLATGRPAG